jgi:peroxiredoxin
MANNLTGAYEAVVQLAVRQINGLLATLHQRGATEDAPLKLLHSVTAAVGHRPRRPPGVEGFGDWVLEYQRVNPESRGLPDVRTQLTDTAPPGAARRFADAFAGFGDVLAPPEEPPDPTRGRVKMQLSSVTISVTDGSTSEITLHAHVRAHYYPEPETPDLPAPIHGEVQAAFEVRRAFAGLGRRRLLIRPSPQDSKIQFVAAPGSGLSAADAGRISAQVRKVVREGFSLLPVDLPPGFPFAEFKGLGTGAGQVLVLPLQLSGAAPPPGGLQTVTQPFVDSSGFAFGVGREYVQGLIDVEAIREAIRSRRLTIGVDLWLGSVTATYRFRFSSGPTLTFKSGAIEISGRVEVETSTTLAPNGWVTFKQDVVLTLDPASQAVGLRRAGEPDVDESWFIPHGTAVDVVKTEVDRALSANEPGIRKVFSDAKSDLVEGLRTFDAAATARYTAVEITPDGIVVRGELDSTPRAAPVVDIAETDGDTAFTAFQSWIPGGRIERLVWSWVEYSSLHPTPWSGVTRSFTDDHRFVFPKPAGVSELSHICLRIEGTQTLPSGQVVSVAGGTTCRVPEFEAVMDVPSWWEPVMVPVWLPDVADGVALKDAIAGHVTVQSITPQKRGLTQNSLVYFADAASDSPLAVLPRAYGLMRRKRFALGVIVVLPAGAFDRRRRDLEAHLASLGERFPARVLLTEDDEGGWTRTFAPARTPAFYLIDARRAFVWKHEGEVAPDALAAALDTHLVPAPAPRPGPLRLAVSPGDRAPDAVFQDEAGEPFALHRLRGRPLLLNFWQSWSAPCLRELRRLQGLRAGGGPEAPFVVAFHGGKDGRGLGELGRRLGLDFPLVQDADQRVARAYGIRCWPTNVWVDPEGRVSHVQFGIEPERERTAGGYVPPTSA